MKRVMGLYNKVKGLLGSNSPILSNVIGSVLVRGGGFIIAILSMPLYLNYFDDNAVLGIWFALLAVLSWMLSFDLGIGNGLRNNLVESLAKGDDELTNKNISSSYILIGIITLLFVLTSLVVFPFLNWNKILNIGADVIQKNTLLEVVQIVFVGVLLQFFFKLINSILLAIQKAALTNLLTFISVCLQVAYLFMGRTGDVNKDLLHLAWVQAISVNLPLLVASIWVFYKELRTVQIRFSFYDHGVALALLKLGLHFFVIQFLYMIIATTNEYFITYFFGSSYVVDYQIYMKIFSVIGSIFAMAMIPIWSAVTKAFVENNMAWIQRLNKILFKVGFVTILLQFALIPLLQPIFDIWLGVKSIEVNYFYAFVFALYSAQTIWMMILSTIANGLGRLKVQLITYLFAVIMKVIFIIVFSNFYNEWILVILSTIISMLPFCIIQPYQTLKIINYQTRLSI